MISLFDLVKVPKTASDLRASAHAQQTPNLSTRRVGPSSHRQSDSTRLGRNGRRLISPDSTAIGSDVSLNAGVIWYLGDGWVCEAARSPSSPQWSPGWWWPGAKVLARYADPAGTAGLLGPPTRRPELLARRRNVGCEAVRTLSTRRDRDCHCADEGERDDEDPRS
jgi:hypothetical protein